MLRSVLVALAIAAGSLPVLAGAVDPEIHKLCLEARDYPGCVKAMKGDDATGEPTMRVINQRGASIVEGNSCPAYMAYRGGGDCQLVICQSPHSWFVGKHHEELGGKRWSCKNGKPGTGGGRLNYGSRMGRLYNEESCPPGQPEIGWKSTCDTAPNQEDSAPWDVSAE